MQHGQEKLGSAVQHCEQALSLDRYNANAFVNRGNVYFINNELKLAQQCYKSVKRAATQAYHGTWFREALQIEASCVQATYNLGLVNLKLNELEEAKRCFFKLNDMLVNNVQTLVQLAQMYMRFFANHLIHYII